MDIIGVSAMTSRAAMMPTQIPEPLDGDVNRVRPCSYISATLAVLA